MAESAVATAPAKKADAKPVAQAAAPEEPKPLNLAQRMAAIRVEADAIGKEDIKMEKDGKKWTIKGHTVEAVLSEMRPLFHKHGVHFTPQLVSRVQSGNRCDIEVDFEFMDLMTGEAKTIRWGGSGTDNSDKAFAKAGTNALKEMLKKVFLVTDRDDAKEEEEKVEHQTDEGLTRAQVDKVAEKAREATEKWAKTFKLSIDGAKNAKEVERLYRDNKTQLDELPEITRQFFAEKKIAALGRFEQPPAPQSQGEDDE
jgi:hypothetical protein